MYTAHAKKKKPTFTSSLSKRSLYNPSTNLPFFSLRRICRDQAGLGTLEVVVLIAILLAIALIFNENIRSFANKLFTSVFNDGRVLKEINQR
ncbi:MAG TPA: hypothetical protein GX717_06815 [Clostridiaceae bacterium]|nr:hypothetical protein [Clostridiaceae bacterium]